MDGRALEYNGGRHSRYVADASSVEFVLICVHVVAGYGACAEIGLVKGVGVVFAKSIASWGEAFFALSLTTNQLATCEYCLSSMRVRYATLWRSDLGFPRPLDM